MNLEKILNKASLKLVNDSRKLRVESKFYCTNRGDLGLLFFLIIALFLLYISLFEAKELGVQIFLSVLSVAILVFTIMVILKQLKDFVEVSKGSIKFSNSLKEKEIQLNSDFKIKVKSDIIHTKTRRNSSGTYFCVIELFLKIKDEKHRILDFQVEEKYSKEAKELGKEIKKIILEITNKV
jgi:hypothetical protein